MCGIFGVVRRRSARRPPDLAELLARVDDVQGRLEGWSGDVAALDTAAAALLDVDTALRGVPGVQALLADRAGAGALGERVATIAARLAAIEGRLDAGETQQEIAELERVNAALLAARDPLWAIGHDRLRTADAVGEFAGSQPVPRRARGVHVDPARPLGTRPARGPGPRLGRAASDGARPPAGPGRPGPRRADRRAGRRPALRVRRGPHPRRHARVRLQGRGGDR